MILIILAKNLFRILKNDVRIQKKCIPPINSSPIKKVVPIVIWFPKRVDLVSWFLLEVVMKTFWNVLEMNSNVLVAIRSALFMEHS